MPRYRHPEARDHGADSRRRRLRARARARWRSPKRQIPRLGCACAMTYRPEMDSTASPEATDERVGLLALVGQLRARLRRHAMAGVWAAPAGATRRPPRVLVDDDAPPLEIVEIPVAEPPVERAL